MPGNSLTNILRSLLFVNFIHLDQRSHSAVLFMGCHELELLHNYRVNEGSFSKLA
jgi:hypothetical protein